MTGKTGADLARELNPGLKEILEDRYGHLLPGMPDTIIDMAYGRFYARPGLDLKSRYIATIAALAASGNQTAPQLRVNIEAGLKAGLSETEIAETIWQMALYGGLPAAINALNTLRSVCGEA
ncbi:carboxymuconolactone decarboxylase [Rhodobacterales bacterium Y4I]|nr:carboxymuconolactone decarboxylase [Rhodobacterales bacterium Y4I]